MKILIVPVSCLLSASTGTGVDGDGHRLMNLLFGWIKEHGFFGNSPEAEPLPIPILYPGDRITEGHAHAFQCLIHRRIEKALMIPYKESRLEFGSGDALMDMGRELLLRHADSPLLIVMVPASVSFLGNMGRAFGLSTPVPTEAKMGWLGHVDRAGAISEWVDLQPPPIVFSVPPPIDWNASDHDDDAPEEESVSEPSDEPPLGVPSDMTMVHTDQMVADTDSEQSDTSALEK